MTPNFKPAACRGFTLAALIVSNAIALNLPAHAQQGTWTSTGDMTAARHDHIATPLTNGKVLIVGGAAGGTAELYDPVTDTFSLTGDPNFDHGSLATATRLLDGRVLVAGGTGGSSAAELYDPVTGTFSVTGSLNEPRDAHVATLLTDGRVLIAGGGTTQAGTATAELFDPSTGTFTYTDSMSIDRRSATATLLSNGQVLIAGGLRITSPGSGARLRSAELYDPTTETFGVTGNMNLPRAGHTATLLFDGEVLMAGAPFMASAELYDPETGTFSATGSMTEPRSSHTATRLPNGQVLIAGGATAIGPVTTNSAELYNPETGMFSATGSMNSARQQYTATLVSDDKVHVLVAGGVGLGGQRLAAAELYDTGVKVSIAVSIDIKPGGFPNSINLSSAGVIPVAILSSDTFDALMVDEETIFLASAGVRVAGRVGVAGRSRKFMCHEEDVNDDGLDDLVCQIETAEFLIEPGEDTAELTAETFDGTPIQGTDSIRIVPR